jgi:hypothetical protein
MAFLRDSSLPMKEWERNWVWSCLITWEGPRFVVTFDLCFGEGCSSNFCFDVFLDVLRESCLVFFGLPIGRQ